MSAESETLLEDLVAADVLVEHDEGERIEPSPRFVREREAQRATLDEAGEAVERYATSLDVDMEELDETIVADALAIQEIAPDVDDRTAVLAADALARFTDDVLVEGVPEGFVPVRANEIATFVEQHDGAVVYLWGDDCEPCDRMREEFETLLEQDAIPDELGLAAVYLGHEADISPETVELIADEWMVTVVPTTLFFLDGRIDSRYYGWKPKEALEREIEILTGYVRGEDVTLEGVDAVGGDAAREGNEEAENVTADDGADEADGGEGEDRGKSGRADANVTEDTTGRDVEEAAGLTPTDATDAMPDQETVLEYIEEMTADDENITVGQGDDEDPADPERPEEREE